MARERMITRTISNTTATVMVANPKTATLENITVQMGGITDKGEMEKLLRKKDTETRKFVAIVAVTVSEQIWGMTEAEFMSHAKILEKR